VKLDLQISGPGITPFATQDRVIASITRLPMITNRKLVALVDPTTNEYQIDWERSALVGGVMPANFTIAEDNKTYDLSGQAGPLMEILQILKANGIGLNNMIDLRSNPAARQQVQAVVRRAAAAQQAPAAPAPAAAAPGAAPYAAPPEPTTAQRLQELETLRATGAISEQEYTAKRQQIIAGL
jgi:pyruvate/2-oxoglutarate dehydrogenase complex dihydrolipoamide acyltransferase (E2) component